MISAWKVGFFGNFSNAKVVLDINLLGRMSGWGGCRIRDDIYIGFMKENKSVQNFWVLNER